MQGQVKERWRELCEQAATEQDPEKLLILVEEITELLQQKQARLYQQRLRQRFQAQSSSGIQNES